MATEPPVLTEREACELANEYPAPGRSRFYGPIGAAEIGAGMILRAVEYPVYLIEEGAFGRLAGPVLVLTHECDLDQANERLLNDMALVCPIVPLAAFVARLNEALDYDNARRFLANVSARYINRVMYLPAIPNFLPLGGYLYLNLLSNTHLSKLLQFERICMLSVDGLRELDFALGRHLLRPNADRIPFQTGDVH